MNRTAIRGLQSAHPIASMLPGVYQDDDLMLRFTGALDTVLAPIFLVLDNMESHFDPMLAPDDFVMWLADWVGLLVDETWPVDFARTAISRTVELYAWRGTVRGVREVLALYTGVEPEITESGGAAWSVDDAPVPPGSPVGMLTVRVPLGDVGTADLRRLDLIVASLKPAHVPHVVELVGRAP